MVSVLISAGIWSKVDLKGEVRRSRGGTAIIMTYMKATSISLFVTSAASVARREIRVHPGVKEERERGDWEERQLEKGAVFQSVLCRDNNWDKNPF